MAGIPKAMRTIMDQAWAKRAENTKGFINDMQTFGLAITEHTAKKIKRVPVEQFLNIKSN